MSPDDQIIPAGRGSTQTSKDTELSPVRAKSNNQVVLTSQFMSPAIYDLTVSAITDINQNLKKAVAIGFNTVLCVDASDEIVQSASALGLQVYLGIDISTMCDDQIIASHPDWFVNIDSEIKFVYLSEADAAVSWWDAQIALRIEQGITGFFARDVAAVPATIWQHIITNAHAINPNIQFIAATPGCTPEQINGLCGCGFTFSLSSSCWWDYSAGWLNEETARLVRLAPPIALTCPVANRSTFPISEHIRRRALVLATTFSIGWMMPCGFEAGDGYQLDTYIAELNDLRFKTQTLQAAGPAEVISSPGADIAILTRNKKFLVAANASTVTSAQLAIASYAAHLSDSGVSFVAADHEAIPEPHQSITLTPAGIRMFHTEAAKSIISCKKSIPNCDAPRIAIEDITPKVESGQFPVRRIVGENLVIEADIIADGHDKLAAEIIFRPVTETTWQTQPMQLRSNDRWYAEISLPRVGRYVYAIRTWKDFYATFIDEITKKHNAGIDTHLEIAEGIALIEQTIAIGDPKTTKPLSVLLQKLSTMTDEAKRTLLISEQTIQLTQKADIHKFSTQSAEIIVDAERLGARFANWYEIFPRSQSNDANRHGNFADVITQLPRISSMGFDVLYFPPIHPIGKINRKGRNNTLTPAKTDPGSPYAIGNEHGGHDAIHPELGTFEDFQALRLAAAAHGLEIALDFAIQCAPDHPWLKQHKEWFDWRADGSLRYAENPPKKYEDIVNVDFYAEGAKPSLWQALRDIVQFWVNQGIKIFRVDNPHTKPLPFWEWLINDIRSRHPEVIFLAEAFTRPKVMYRLAKIGFSQSYTYFTWRNTKKELQDYLVELTTSAPKEFFRPHFFVNTPDINPIFLHGSGRPGFLIRAVLAATLSGLWGVYNGFELCEAASVSGKEEYRDSEKYQLRVWDHQAPDNIVAEIALLNKIRRTNRALQSHLGVEFHNVYDDQIIFFSKTSSDGNVILVAISLDPFNTHQTTLDLPLSKFGLPDDGSLWAEDLMREHQFIWQGRYQHVTLHPEQPFCIWRVQKHSA